MGIGQAGGNEYPLCAGRVQPPVNGAYPITVACSDYGTNGLSMTVADGTLSLHVPASAGSPAYTIAWVPAAATMQAAPPSQSGNTVPAWLVGTWQGPYDYESFTVTSTGAVTWSLLDQLGNTVTGSGTLESMPGGTYLINTNIGSPPVAAFWQLTHLIDGQLEVVGGYGPQAFTLSAG
jgi:hypothetical protein